MGDNIRSTEFKATGNNISGDHRDNSGWIVDYPMTDKTADLAVVSCPPSWIHSDPTDYEGLSEGDLSDGSSHDDQSIASEPEQCSGPDSEFIIPPLSSSPLEVFSSSPEHDDARSYFAKGGNFTFDQIYAHTCTPLTSPGCHSPIVWSYPRRRPFLVPISTQNPGSPASPSTTTISPMSSRSISFQSSQMSDQSSRDRGYDAECEDQEMHFTTKLHDLLLMAQQERLGNGYSRRLFRTPSDESRLDTDIEDIRERFTPIEYQPYSKSGTNSQHSPSSLKRKRADSGSLEVIDHQVSRVSQDYLPFGRYRLIKRAESYQAWMLGKERQSHIMTNLPPSKRRKMTTRPLGMHNGRSPYVSSTNYGLKAEANCKLSCKGASYRRAESLKAPSSGSSPLFSPVSKQQAFRRRSGDEKENKSPKTHHTLRKRLEAYTPLKQPDQIGASSSAWVATVPSTPIRQSIQASSITPKQRRLTRKSDLNAGLRSPVPIIAPPKDPVWHMPLTPTAEAKVRLRVYLERERQREKRFKEETSEVTTNSPHEIKIRWERSLGLGRKTRQDCVGWLLTVLPKLSPKTNEKNSSPVLPSQSIVAQVSPGSSSHSSSSQSQEFDDPECELDFTVTRLLSTSTDAQSGTYSPADPEVSTTSDKTCQPPQSGSARSRTSPEGNVIDTSFNLSDQLHHSPETRFHAVWMFLRYFWLIDYGTQSSGFDVDGECIYPGEDNEEKLLRSLLIWDATVGSLALSVKLHRDFLDPLLPVYADEYLNLAPHSIRMEDLENAQRDIFSALDYTLGDTPQPIMDELWRALPSLRQLLGFDCDWALVMQLTWDRLFACLREPDVLQFSVSLLTTVALMDSVLDFVRKKTARDSDLACGESGHLVNSNRELYGCETDSEMDDEASGVICDIQALIGLTDARVRQCRLWMQANGTQV